MPGYNKLHYPFENYFMFFFFIATISYFPQKWTNFVVCNCKKKQGRLLSIVCCKSQLQGLIVIKVHL